MEFLRQHQLNIMLILTGICGVLGFLALLTSTLSTKRKHALVSIELSAMLLLICDRFAYIYRGDMSTLGYWMVRYCNFLVFFFSLTILHAFNNYLIDLFLHEGKLKTIPVRLLVCKVIFILGVVFLVVAQFTHWYYTFDEFNRYVRGNAFFLCYLFPFSILIIQFSVILQYYTSLRRMIRIPLLIFAVFPFIATGVQVFTYGLSLTNIAIVGEAIILYIFVLLDLNDTVAKANTREIDLLKEEQKKMRVMFEQTTRALATSIDAKDEYTHGHSMRVAEYAQKIAMVAGKEMNFCSEVYFAGLLHDVGKIGVPNSIINKNGKLTPEEFAEIKKHPVIGKQILSSISMSPYLSIAANSHHERYDGRGYPEGLKGEDIPEIARIIAVADAYDAMTSKRSYRDPIPQQKVREEIVKGMGYQFDPAFAKIMLHLIDLDTEYTMKEHNEIHELAGKNELECLEMRSAYSEGFLLSPYITIFKMKCRCQNGIPVKDSVYSFLLFDSLDGRIHYADGQDKEMLYTEYAEIHFDGSTEKKDSRKIKTIISPNGILASDWTQAFKEGVEFEGEIVRFHDHVLIKLNNKFQNITVTVALPDSSRYVYLCLTGMHCSFSNVEIFQTQNLIDENYIPRIAEPISYINGPQGDIPNVQVDGWRTASSEAILVTDSISISFHSKSLPTARLIWHCPFISLFYSDDKKPGGKNYKEFVLVRIDGENWDENELAENSIIINKNDDFEGWTAWKEMNKNGFDCEVHLRREGNKISVITENGGISIKSITTLKDPQSKVYASLTGDQCAITNIKIKRGF